MNRDPRHKYLNQTQLLQHVCQVDEPELSQGECLFLLTLAAFTVRTFPAPQNYPHPGNQVLMAACRITSRKGVNYIANQLAAKKLIEIVEVGNGRGKATVYRIRVEDDRFPWPKEKDKPGSSDFPDSKGNPEVQTSHFQSEKPGSNEPETRKLDPVNPEVKPEKPGSLNFHTDSNPLIQSSNTSANKSAPDPSDRLYLEKLKKLSDSVTDALVHRMLGDDNFEPDYFGDIRKLFQSEADDLAVDYKDFQNLYRGSMRTAEWVVTPAALVGPGPITEELIEKWAADVASNPDVLEIIRDGGTALTLVFANGIEEHYIGHDEPYWFPFDDETQIKGVEEDPVLAHAMPDVPGVPA